MLTINGVPLGYDEAGSGPPLLLIHAGIVDRRMWDDVWPDLTARHRVVRLDLRGFGDTPLPDGPFVYTDDAAKLLLALGIDRASVIGVSMGGHVAIDLAIAHPEMVEKLIVVASGIDGWEHSDAMKAEWDLEEAAWETGDLDEVAWVNVRTWLDGPSRGPDALPAELRQQVWEMQRKALAYDNDDARGSWATESRRARLGEISAPTLVMVGELDQPDFGEIARMLAAEIPDARFQELPGVAHLPPMEAPDEFSRVVLDFLDPDPAA
ncbi:MAG TPA: alpha/beta fold hydrolase [Candidatus Limnocylindrales bacterium]|nr:alpha/beta fold hydrolase [Candidatus Limnocylindrales bacterium]